MIELTSNYTKQRLASIEELYIKAFPEIERKPFSLILDKCHEGYMEILSIEDNKEFSGLAIIIKYKDIILVDYLAICENKRNNKIGSNTLKILHDKYSEYRIMLEIENTNIQHCSNLDERIRRKSFYLKNGMTPLNYIIDLFGVEMEILTFDCNLSFDEYHNIFRNVFSEKTAQNVKFIKYIE